MAQDASFLGRGWSFPPEFTVPTRSAPAAPGAALLPGEVRMSEGEQDIRESLSVLFQTAIGERFMHPKYGLDLRDLLFEPLNTTTTTLLEDRVRVAIAIYEPRIRLLTLSLRVDELQAPGQALLELDYVVMSTNSRFNLVYPFYRSDASEVGGVR